MRPRWTTTMVAPRFFLPGMLASIDRESTSYVQKRRATVTTETQGVTILTPLTVFSSSESVTVILNNSHSLGGFCRLQKHATYNTTQKDLKIAQRNT